MQRNPFQDLIGINSPQGQMQQGVQDYSQLFTEYRKPKKQQIKPQKGFWTDQISTGGGIGGALGGAATGAAIGSIVPGIGTAIGGLVGGIAGGALGSGAGEFTENVITGEQDKFKNVGQEALLGGIFAAPPLRLAKGIGAAGKAAFSNTAGTTAKGALENALLGKAGKAAVQSGVERAGRGSLGQAWGIRPGVKISGQHLTPQRAKSLQEFAKTNIGVPKTSSAEMVFERAVNHQGQVGKAISSTIESLPPNSINVKALRSGIMGRFDKLLGVDASKNQVAKDILTQVNQAKTPQQLWALRKEIDNTLINFSRNPNSVVPGAERAALAARTEISNALSKAAPALKPLNKQYSDVIDVINLTADAARTPKGFKLPGFQQTIGGGNAQRIKAATGNAAEGGRTFASKAGGLLSGKTGTALREGVGLNMFGSEPQQPDLEQALLQMQDSGMTEQGAPMQDPYAQQAVDANPYPRENLMYDIQRDPANADAYIEYYQQMQEIFPPAGNPAADLSQSNQSALASADNAINTLNQLEQLYANAGGGSGRLGGAVQNLAGTAGLDKNASVYNSLSQASVTQIAKALAGSGAGTVSDADAKVIIAALPTLQDSPEEAQAKFAALRQRLQAAKDNVMAYGSGGTSNDLASVLMQQQGGY